MSQVRAAALIAGVVLAGAPIRAVAQEWRTLTSSRQLQSDAPATVRVEYVAGTLDLAPTTDPVLYRTALRYDAERTVPLAAFDAGSRSLTVGTRSASRTDWKSGNRDGSSLTAALTTRAPLRLFLELGASRADVQLGGLRLSELEVRTGASEVRLDVSTPNSEDLVRFDLDVGAADVTVRNGGNLRARVTHVNVGAGALDYDLGGSWDGEMDVSANVAVGSMTLRAPTDVGLRIVARTFLAGFEKAGLEKRGDAWYSPDYDAAKRRATVRVTAVIGGFEVIRR